MPMKRSGRSVAAASRVIEIEDVLVARIASGFSDGQSVDVDLALDVFLLGRRLDDEVAIARSPPSMFGAFDALQRSLPLILGDRPSWRPGAPCCR